MSDKLQNWDVFICHASEDKDAFVRPLAKALGMLGVSVWFDEFSLQVGDSISRFIDKGLSGSKYGLVVISPVFIGKPWPEYELRGLVSREIDEDKVILPIWHGVTRGQVVQFSPPLADKLAIDTSSVSAQEVAIEILKVVRPDLYKRHPRAQLERIASGEAMQDLQREIDRTQEQLEAAREELSQYKCPHCEAPMVERIHAPTDPEEKDWDWRDVYECGYVSFGGYMERPCPSDPRFPKLEEYELQSRYNPDESHWKWECFAIPKTDMARRLHIMRGLGRTKKEAEQAVREEYNRYARRAKA